MQKRNNAKKKRKALERNKRQASHRAERQKRTCGGCRACCYVFPLGQKPARQWCQHVTATGCGLHDSPRPAICGSYRCMWLDYTEMPQKYRPDKCGYVITRRVPYKGHYVVVLTQCCEGVVVPHELVKVFRRAGLLVVVNRRKVPFTTVPGTFPLTRCYAPDGGCAETSPHAN